MNCVNVRSWRPVVAVLLMTVLCYNEIVSRAGGMVTTCADGQREWVKIQVQLLHVKVKEVPQLPPEEWRQHVFRFVEHWRFGWSIMACIILNTVIVVCVEVL